MKFTVILVEFYNLFVILFFKKNLTLRFYCVLVLFHQINYLLNLGTLYSFSSML